MLDDKQSADLDLVPKKQPDQECSEIRAYKRRWIVLSIFIVYAAVNSYQWIEYSIITHIVMRYYNVSAVTVDWTSIIYMALYAPLVIPASFILDKQGLRVAGLIGVFGTAIGTAIKVLSINPDRFWVVLLGQGILSATQLFIICLPPKIAAVWFKSSEVSTACSLGVFGTQIGCAIGYILTPIIVKNHQDVENIGSDLNILSWGLTVVMIPTVFAVLIYFPLEPPKPPSIPQANKRENEEPFSTNLFLTSVKNLMSNKPFVIHMVAYGINLGVFSAVGILLGQIVLSYFPNSDEYAGTLGLLITMVGIAGSVLFGVILDKTHKYKGTAVFTCVISTASILMLLFALEKESKLLGYIAASIVGFFLTGYLPVGFEFAMELTFPQSEGTTSGILMAPSQIFGVIFALTLGKLLKVVGPFWGLASQALLLAIGSCITIFIPNILHRQDAVKLGVMKTNVTPLNS